MNETKPSSISVGRVFLALFTLFLIFVSGATVYRIVARTVRDRYEAETRSQMAVALAEARFAYARSQTAAALGELRNDPVYAAECRKYCDLARQHLDVVAMNARQEEVRKRCEVFSRDIEDGWQFVEMREDLTRELLELGTKTIMLRNRFDQLHGERSGMLHVQAETQRHEIDEKPFVPEFLLQKRDQLAQLVEQTERVFTLSLRSEFAVNLEDRVVLDKEIEEALLGLKAEHEEMKQQMTTAQAKDFVQKWEQTLHELTRLIQARGDISERLQRLSEEQASMAMEIEQNFDKLAEVLNMESHEEAEIQSRWISRVALFCGVGFLFWLFYGILLAVFLIRRAPAATESDFSREHPLVATPATPFPVRAACDMEPVLAKLQEIIELLKR